MKTRVLALFVIAALFAAAAFHNSYSEDTTIVCVPVAERERIREVVLDGIDQALKNHVLKLFDIWMKDESNQPKRAIEGMAIGISAHVRARANAQNWNPPPC